ncbi:MAG TPA: hypothetical protein PK402_09690, partial [Tepidisphaeraceae bacterium]|nr:hypothetical protein [Tepidisphaeraceae bacterium]
LFLMLIASTAQAAVTGRVESIGFDGAYRPSCWTPMRVVVTPDVDTKTGQYEIRITQRDLDGDHPIYRTPITLTAGEGEQRFWTYFLPESVQYGLPDQDLSELAQRLLVTLHDADGKELATFALEQINLKRIDPSRGARSRGGMFILRTPPSVRLLTDSLLPARSGDEYGITRVHQDFRITTISADGFPDRAIGLEAVDTILWLDGDPLTQLGGGNSTRLDALRESVRLGGHLVINTPAQWQVLSNWGDLMPVDVTGVESRATTKPIFSLANKRSFSRMLKREGAPDEHLPNPWDRMQGLSFQFAHARLRPGAIELVPIVWKEATEEIPSTQPSTQQSTNPTTSTPAITSPWLASKSYGYGCVTWIGSNIADFQDANYGWEVVWPAIFGAIRTGDSSDIAPISVADLKTTDRQGSLENTSSADIAKSLLKGIALTSKTAALVGAAAIFFVVYWAAAGPGLYIFLRAKNKMHLNWFAFGAAALIGLGATLVLVKLLVRGPPDMRHISLVRIDQINNNPAMIRSRIGMYIPRDGTQQITLGPGKSAALLPYLSHPNFTDQTSLVPRPIPYDVPSAAHDPKLDQPAELDLPYRSSLKRVEARWQGSNLARIDGSLSMTTRDPFVEGKLTNRTGIELKNIYFAFTYKWSTGWKDYVMFVPKWAVDETIDIAPI